MDVLVFDPYAINEQIEALGAGRVEFTELLQKSDLVSIHAPSTPATRHIFNADTLALLKPTAILINTSRGPLIEEAALVEALQHNRIGGAGLDVYEVEPLPADSPLRSLDNVLLSPHVSGMDKMAKRKVTERCVSNILNFLSGQRDAICPYTVNPETLMENSK
jgi:D-3-phosphoglycerate dehydrogenase